MKNFDLLKLLAIADEDTIEELKKLSAELARTYYIDLLFKKKSNKEIEKLHILTDDYIIYWYMIATEHKTIFLIDEHETKTNIFIKELNKLGIPDATVQYAISFAVRAEAIASKYSSK